MKKISKKILPALLIGLLSVQACATNATNNRTQLVLECNRIGLSLQQLAKTKSNEHCTVDVIQSSSSMLQASQAIRSNDDRRGFLKLSQTRQKLQTIQTSNRECPYLSMKVSPYLLTVFYLMTQVGQSGHSISTNPPLFN